ncbi:hypothetical protein SFUMM280S_04970 [Streptomyces fumanus]
MAGIAAMKQGNRLVDISRAIETYIRRQPKPGGGRYGSSRTTAATASAPRCTWTRTC